MLRSWTIPVTANGNLVKDGYRPGDGDQMVEVVSVADVERMLIELSADFAAPHFDAGEVITRVREEIRRAASDTHGSA